MKVLPADRLNQTIHSVLCLYETSLLKTTECVIDPLHSLAFSIQANPGVYAVLIGSGVSRAAKIPTGWEITLNLIRKLAKLHNEECEPDPDRWYLEKFRKEASYSDLLNGLAKTQSERQQLLREYFEPTDEEREADEKAPTAAHRAIAKLAAQGFVRVIITTNFDRLFETALNDVGVTPTILSSPDQVKGALPLIHTKCCLLKVHGDYFDTRIRNTPSELKKYPVEFNNLLDRIFDEFGLIVCGWSAEWDGALGDAITRAPSRRFTTYWTVRRKPTENAQKLINHREAQVIAIEDADTFFEKVQQCVQSIEEFSRPHPLSTEAAVASLKRYMSEPRYQIKLSDLVDETVKRVVEVTSGKAFAVQDAPKPNRKSITTRVRGYQETCSTLLGMAVTAGYWAKSEHYLVWERALQRLGLRKPTAGYDTLIWLQRYPATLLLYALGLGAIEGNRLPFLKRMLVTSLQKENQEEAPAGQVLPPFCMFPNGGKGRQLLEGMTNRNAPLNDWIHDIMWSHSKRIIPDKSRYTLIFDKLEILLSLSSVNLSNKIIHGGTPIPGAYGYRQENRIRILQEIEDSLSSKKAESPYVISGIFGATETECQGAVRALEKFILKLQWI